jgi:hypothetical protein
VSESPIEQLLEALDKLDVERAMGLLARDGRLMTADGRRAHGADAVRELVGDFCSTVRSTSHRITAQWHLDNVWIAEVDADYELADRLQLTALPRAFIVYEGPDGIADLRIYGAHEQPLSEHRGSQFGLRIGERWIPPL